MRARNGISTAVQMRKPYSIVNTTTENSSKARNFDPWAAASSGTVSATKAVMLSVMRPMMHASNTRLA